MKTNYVKFATCAILLTSAMSANAQSVLGKVLKNAATTVVTEEANKTENKQKIENAKKKAETVKKTVTNAKTKASTIKNAISSASKAAESASSAIKNNSTLLSGLSTIFNSKNTASEEDLVGTWKYIEPAVVFSSENALSNLGGKVASQAIEKKLQTTLNKKGIKKGMMSMTFDKNGNFTQTINKKKLSGTYTISGKNVVLKYGGTVSQIVGTTQIEGNSLLIVMDASKLLNYTKTLSKLSGNSTLSTASSLLSNMNGMQCGLRLQK